MELNQVYNMAAVDGLRQLSDDIVIITDPPYGINLNLEWLSEVHLAKQTPRNKADILQDDDEPTDITPLFRFKRRLIFGFPYLYDPHATGWVVWDKQPKIAERTIVTPVEVASTTLRKGWDVIRVMWGGYMRDNQVGEQRFAHPTQKPLKLMHRIVEKFTKSDEVIVDPYCGTGSTLIAAKQLGREFVGFDINADYCRIATQRLQQKQLSRNSLIATEVASISCDPQLSQERHTSPFRERKEGDPNGKV